MISEDKFNLRPVWDATLEIYEAVDAVCRRHGLRHYVTDGTLIGTVRHKGFVPWDDDFDMSMPREDYEKFIKYAKDELPPYLKFVNWHNTPEFHGLFGKVQDCRREVVESLERQTGRVLSNGLFIDIFPIEGYPESRLGKLKIKIVDFFLTQLMAWRFGSFKKRSWKGKLLTPVGIAVGCVAPWLKTHSDILKVYEKMLRQYPFEGCRNTGRASR
ncbi:MAG: LicD family protein [Kiritimatiellae bacterium]|nr:LicD family protein [Kiritimatiellia bacterium]